MIEFVLVYNEEKLSGKLTKFFTGSYAYHCGFLDKDSDTFYDMDWLPRKVHWSKKKYKQFRAYEIPELTKEDCEEYLKRDSRKMTYGFVDYVLFGIKPIYHLLGKSTRNAKGWICSEMCLEWMKRVGVSLPWYREDPPSPADLERMFYFSHNIMREEGF